MKQKNLDIIGYSLFIGWMFAFLFDKLTTGDLLRHRPEELPVLYGATAAAHCIGLVLCMFLLNTARTMRRINVAVTMFCLAAQLFFPFSPFPVQVALGALMGAGTAAVVVGMGWAIREHTVPSERTLYIADVLAGAFLLQTLTHALIATAGKESGYFLTLTVMAATFVLACCRGVQAALPEPEKPEFPLSRFPLFFLAGFILLIGIDLGAVFRIFKPACGQYFECERLLDPLFLLLTILVLRQLRARLARLHALYLALALFGIGVVLVSLHPEGFWHFTSVNLLLMASRGVFELFWWSMLARLVDYCSPAKLFGLGLGARLIGRTFGAELGQWAVTCEFAPALLAAISLSLVFLIMYLTPFLERVLTRILKQHEFLNRFSELKPELQQQLICREEPFHDLSIREQEVVRLLLRGYTYNMAAQELHISENTLKTHVKNIYSKLRINSKIELTRLFLASRRSSEQPTVNEEVVWPVK